MKIGAIHDETMVKSYMFLKMIAFRIINLLFPYFLLLWTLPSHEHDDRLILNTYHNPVCHDHNSQAITTSQL